MACPVVPAIIPASSDEVRTMCARLAFSLELHLDVVDKVFVPYVSWPYEPAGDPVEVKADTDRFTLEVDLMVHKPLLAAERWLAAGADMLVFHAETIDVESFRQFTASTNISVGISALNDTSDEVLRPYVPYADYVQVMGIAAIGAQGQQFDERSLSRIATIAQEFPHLLISVDGSVNATTLPRLFAAGAGRFITGSAVVGDADPAAAHFKLSQLTH